MKKYLYSFKDDVAGTYDYFGCFVSDALAIRQFKMSTSSPDIPAADLSLYRFGSYDTETGVINGDEIEFLIRGEKHEI